MQMRNFFRKELDKIIKIVNEEIIEIEEVYLKGSLCKEDSNVDFWSDIDLAFVLGDKYDVKEFNVNTIIEELGNIVAYEEFEADNIVLKRVFLQGEKIGYSLDIMILNRVNLSSDILGEESQLIMSNRKSQVSDEVHINTEIIEEQGDEYISDKNINEFWFKVVVAIKKIMRNDNLIGVHLVLDIIRELIVLQMINRDIKKGTSIHRYGDDEQIDILNKININSEKINKESLLDIIDECAKYYDDEVSKLVNNYDNRYIYIKKYIEDSRSKIK